MIGWRIKAALASVGAFLLALLGAFRFGARTTKDKHKAEKADAYIKTDKAVDAARGSLDAGDNREWLRKRGERQP